MKKTINYYVAGGAVRDMLLGRAPQDVDYAFNGSEEHFIQSNSAACKLGVWPNATFIHEGQEFVPLYEESPSADLARRDFTVNALLLDQNGILRMHPQSIPDLKNGVIRPASPSSFAKDPVRAYRAARFTASMPDFSLHRECLAQAALLDARTLASIASERVGQEAIKACRAQKPGNFLRALAVMKLFRPWFSSLAQAEKIPAGPQPFHDSSVLEHTAQVMDDVAMLAREKGFDGERDETRTTAVWMALCHDLGKTLTPEEELPRHHRHEEKGEQPAEEFGKKLSLPKKYSTAGAVASLLHMKGARYDALRIGTRVDLLHILQAKRLLAPFFLMVSCDAEQTDLFDRALSDAHALSLVKLPKEWRNMGPASAQHLRTMRCMALAGGSKCNKKKS